VVKHGSFLHVFLYFVHFSTEKFWQRLNIYTINARDEFSNVSVTDADAALSRDAYVTSHLFAVNLACTHGLAGRVDARAAAATVQPYIRGGGVVKV